MNIQTLANNLKNTIAGKERHLAAMRTQTESLGACLPAVVGMRMPELTIDELQKIFADVEATG